MIYVSIDIETTGLDFENHQIIELGAVIEDTNNRLPLDRLPRYSVVVKPDKYLVGDPFALNMNRDLISLIASGPEKNPEVKFVSASELADDFYNWLLEQGLETKLSSKGYEYITINVAGKNFSAFDQIFLEKVPNMTKKIRFRRRVLDPSILYLDLENDSVLPSLGDCKKRAGLSMDGFVSHRAVDDAMDVIELLRLKFFK